MVAFGWAVLVVPEHCSRTLFLHLPFGWQKNMGEHCSCQPNEQEHVREHALLTPQKSRCEKCMFANMFLLVRVLRTRSRTARTAIRTQPYSLIHYFPKSDLTSVGRVGTNNDDVRVCVVLISSRESLFHVDFGDVTTTSSSRNLELFSREGQECDQIRTAMHRRVWQTQKSSNA